MNERLDDEVACSICGTRFKRQSNKKYCSPGCGYQADVTRRRLASQAERKMPSEEEVIALKDAFQRWLRGRPPLHLDGSSDEHQTDEVGCRGCANTFFPQEPMQVFCRGCARWGRRPRFCAGCGGRFDQRPRLWKDCCSEDCFHAVVRRRSVSVRIAALSRWVVGEHLDSDRHCDACGGPILDEARRRYCCDECLLLMTDHQQRQRRLDQRESRDAGV